VVCSLSAFAPSFEDASALNFAIVCLRHVQLRISSRPPAHRLANITITIRTALRSSTEFRSSAEVKVSANSLPR
jgi:hypothetical protein